MSIIQKRYNNCKNLGFSTLNLSNCKIKTYDEIKGLDFSFFSSIDLSHNYLNTIPEELTRIKNLRELIIRYNCINAFSDFHVHLINESNLMYIDLSFNNINFVPDEFYLLDEKLDLRIEGNSFLNGLPDSAGEKSIFEILHLIDLFEHGKTSRFFEGKVILVGRGEVGKTALANKITTPKYILPETPILSTRGIDILNCNLPVIYEFSRSEEYLMMEGEYDDFYFQGIKYSEAYDAYFKQAKINIWDFGGQEIYYNLHHLFLTENAVYLYVWDSRKEETIDDFDYWLNSIEALSNKSPILVVQNKIDKRQKNINEADLRNNFKSIQNFHNISVKNGEGIEELIEDIIFELSNIPIVNKIVPDYWIELRDKLKEVKKKYITIEEFDDLVPYHIKLQLSENRRNAFLKFITDLGNALFYPSNQVLSDIIILDPEWATTSFYGLIENRDIQNNKGRFTYSDAKKAWKGKNYPSGSQTYLLQLLCHFNVCFNLIGTNEYLLPELFDHTPPLGEIHVKNNASFSFRWEFNFFPSSIIPHLICRLHSNILKELYWRSGFVVSDRYNSSALVEENIRDKSIMCTAVGPEKEKLLVLIRNEVDSYLQKINLEIDKDYREFIPCRCSICIKSDVKTDYSTNTLKRYKQKNKQFITCDNSIEDINIDLLLNGYRKGKNVPELLRDLLVVCSQLQGTSISIKRGEDDRNSFVCTMMKNRGFLGFDQTRWGKSATGKLAGELDVKFEDFDGMTMGIFEGMNLSYLDKNSVSSHFRKLFNYDPNGLNENFIVIYSESNNFIDLYRRYGEFIPKIGATHEIIEPFIDVSDHYSNGSEIKVGLTGYRRSNKKCYIYHIFVNMKN